MEKKVDNVELFLRSGMSVERIVLLTDVMDEEFEDQAVVVNANSIGVCVGLPIKGGGSDSRLMVEQYEGKLRVVIWSNPDQEDPTYVIPLT